MKKRILCRLGEALTHKNFKNEPMKGVPYKGEKENEVQSNIEEKDLYNCIYLRNKAFLHPHPSNIQNPPLNKYHA